MFETMHDLTFATASELIRIPSAALVYVTADGNYSSITMADGSVYVLTQQLGQIERKLADALSASDRRFVRIGKSLIVNREFITFIHPVRQKLTLSDCRSFKHEVSASRDALKALKDLLEKEAMK